MRRAQSPLRGGTSLTLEPASLPAHVWGPPCPRSPGVVSLGVAYHPPPPTPPALLTMPPYPLQLPRTGAKVGCGYWELRGGFRGI